MRCRAAARLLLVASLGGAAWLPAPARAQEEGVARVVLNGVERGAFRFVRETEALLFTVEDLRAMGFTSLPRGAPEGPGDWISLRTFFPPVFAELDAATSTIQVRADPTLLGRRVVDLAPRPRAGVLRPESGSALFNYGVHWSPSSDGATEALSVPGELAISGGGFSLVSNGSYSRVGTLEKWTRGMTTFSADEPTRNLRFFAGDTFASAGSFGSGVALAGFGVASEFSMTPALLTRGGLDVSGVLKTASEVEVWVNDLLVRKERFGPGEFELQNLPGAGGAADVTLVIRDALGREQRITDATYLASRLLPPGLHDLSYAVGVKRQDSGGATFRYGGPAFLAYHRAGVSGSFTGGLRVEADDRLVNGGPLATFRVGRLGELDLAGAYSRRGDAEGAAGSAAWSYSAPRFSLGLSGRAYSRDYARLTLLPDASRPRLEGTASLGLRAGVVGAFSLGLEHSQRYLAPDRTRASLRYQRTLGRRVSLMLSGARTISDATTWDVSASLLWRLWERSTGSLGVSRNGDGTTSASAVLQRGAPLGPGVGYRLGGGAKEEGSSGVRTAQGDLSLEYHGELANVAASYGRRDARDVYEASITGALALIDESIFLTRPIRDGFALVKVGTESGIPVLLNHQPAGTTGAGGGLLVPGLTSYYDALLSIDVASLPVNYQVERPSKRVAVGYRNGGVVPFEVRKLRAISGRLLVVEGLRSMVPELWGLEFLSGHEVVEAIVGREGEFYLENVPAGRYAARVFTKGRSCPFVLTIPDHDQPWLELGVIRCELPGGGT